MNYTVNHIPFELVQNQVFSRGLLMPLSSKAHICLIEFLKANGSVVSKEHLMAVLWPEVIVSDDSLFKVIQEVRKELVVAGVEKNVLKNVYGKGYRLQQVESLQLSNGHSLGGFFAGVLLLVLVLVLVFFFLAFSYWSKEEKISDQAYATMISDIESDYIDSQIDFDALGVNSQSLQSDQLKWFYLQALQYYKSGNYQQSIALLNEGIAVYGHKPPNKAIADSYLLLARIYVYRSDKEALKSYIDEARKLYSNIKDPIGVISSDISKARYYQSAFLYADSIDLLESILPEAANIGAGLQVLRIHANLSYSYKQIGQYQAYIDALNHTLEKSLAMSNGRYAAYAYGELSQVYRQQNQPIKAMKFAHQALNFVLAQKDTNVFQQGFSAFYNLLNELGHVSAADKYLKDAIDIQAYFNDQALLVLAEMNWVRVKLNQQKFELAKDILVKLKKFKLSETEALEADSLWALTSYQLQDNISAYTTAKQVYSADGVDERVRLQAGIVLVWACTELERLDEAMVIFSELADGLNRSWRYEYRQYLNLAKHYFKIIAPDETQFAKYQQEFTEFATETVNIINQTQTSSALTTTLDEYISQITRDKSANL